MTSAAHQDQRDRRRLADMPLSTQAALLGSGAAFWRYLNERHGYDVSNPDEAAEAVREMCGVTSRRDIRAGTEAGAKFFELKGNFNVWMTGVE